MPTHLGKKKKKKKNCPWDQVSVIAMMSCSSWSRDNNNTIMTVTSTDRTRSQWSNCQLIDPVTNSLWGLQMADAGEASLLRMASIGGWVDWASTGTQWIYTGDGDDVGDDDIVQIVEPVRSHVIQSPKEEMPDSQWVIFRATYHRTQL